jgi:hypothetical protein
VEAAVTAEGLAIGSLGRVGSAEAAVWAEGFGEWLGEWGHEIQEMKYHLARRWRRRNPCFAKHCNLKVSAAVGSGMFLRRGSVVWGRQQCSGYGHVKKVVLSTVPR